MKHLKQVFAITLTLVLLITGMDLSGIIPNAKAEGTPSTGTTSVPSTPDEVLHAGE